MTAPPSDSPPPTRAAQPHVSSSLEAVSPRRLDRGALAAVVLVLALAGGLELALDRSWLGPDGRFGVWEGSIWSPACSQRLADPYSFSHVAHGILFYGGLWLVARRLPVRHRALIAVVIEAGWELLENSPVIISRYREATIALGYTGDSVLNSLSDIAMMGLGFLLAWRVRPWVSVAVVLAMEIGCVLGAGQPDVECAHAGLPGDSHQAMAVGRPAGTMNHPAHNQFVADFVCNWTQRTPAHRFRLDAALSRS